VEEHDHLRWPFGAGSLLAPRGPDNEIEPTVVDVAPALEHAWARTFRSSESSQFRSFSWAADDELAALFAVWLGEYAGEVGERYRGLYETRLRAEEAEVRAVDFGEHELLAPLDATGATLRGDVFGRRSFAVVVGDPRMLSISRRSGTCVRLVTAPPSTPATSSSTAGSCGNCAATSRAIRSGASGNATSICSASAARRSRLDSNPPANRRLSLCVGAPVRARDARNRPCLARLVAPERLDQASPDQISGPRSRPVDRSAGQAEEVEVAGLSLNIAAGNQCRSAGECEVFRFLQAGDDPATCSWSGLSTYSTRRWRRSQSAHARPTAGGSTSSSHSSRSWSASM
jgi:hypothetical protein